MGGFSSFYARSVANHFFRGDVDASAQGRPAELYLSLHSDDPTDIGSSEGEVSGGAYSRQRIYFGAADTDPVNNREVTFIKNTNNIVFPNLPASEVTHIGIWTEIDGGSLMFSDNFYISAATPSAIVVNNGDSISVPESYIKIYIE
jgi:hypothetical protein